MEKREEPGSQKMQEGLIKENFHVRENFSDIVKKITMRGIGVRTYGFDVHKNRLAEGCLITVYCTNKNPDELCKREHADLMRYVDSKLDVIRHNPYELKQVNSDKIVKIITEVDSEEKADRAFNFAEGEDGKIYGQV